MILPHPHLICAIRAPVACWKVTQSHRIAVETRAVLQIGLVHYHLFAGKFHCKSGCSLNATSQRVVSHSVQLAISIFQQNRNIRAMDYKDMLGSLCLLAAHRYRWSVKIRLFDIILSGLHCTITCKYWPNNVHRLVTLFKSSEPCHYFLHKIDCNNDLLQQAHFLNIWTLMWGGLTARVLRGDGFVQWILGPQFIQKSKNNIWRPFPWASLARDTDWHLLRLWLTIGELCT